MVGNNESGRTGEKGEKNDTEWWVYKHSPGETYGPTDAETLEKWISEERVTGEDFVAEVGSNEWIKLNQLPALRRKGQKDTSTQHPPRWYFMRVGHGNASQIFDLICRSVEGPPTLALADKPETKILVRHYSIIASDIESWIRKADSSGLSYTGFQFPQMDLKKSPEKVKGLEQAYLKMHGGSPENSRVIVILADDRYDAVMRDFYHQLNKEYLQRGLAPINRLFYTDDLESAKSLLSPYCIEETSSIYEKRFDEWCAKNSIDSQFLQ